MNVEVQVCMHVNAMLSRWPSLDREQLTDRVRERVQSGNSWLWPEPVQMELF